jgi:hypothetical protein
MEYVLRLQATATFLATAVSLWFLIRLWREAELFGWQQIVFCVWFVAGTLTLLRATSAGAWVAGLVAQVLLAIVLVLKDRIDNIY